MDPLKVGEFIKNIRKNNNLTQKELADRLHVTYQAVSKWENGINLPEISIIKELAKEFNVGIEDILEGEEQKKNKKNYHIWGLLLIIIILLVVGIFLFVKHDHNNTFNSTSISTTCKEFRVSGFMAYDNTKSAISIHKIDYCGEKDNNTYEVIKCSLYEKVNNDSKLVTSCKEGNNTTLDEFLNDIEIKVDNYEQACKKYSDESLYLDISATKDNKTVTYKVPLKLENNCNK